MGLRSVPHPDQQADAEPGVASHGLPETVGPSPPSCPRRRSPGGVQKNLVAGLDEIARRDAAGKPIEIWFQEVGRAINRSVRKAFLNHCFVTPITRTRS